MPAKIVLILALVTAAAVLVPLRRAKKAFPVRSEVAGIVGTPRVSMRRRPASPRGVIRLPGTLTRRNLTVPPAVRADAAVESVRQAPHLSKAGAVPAWTCTSVHGLSVTPPGGATGVLPDSGDEVVPDRTDRLALLSPVEAPAVDTPPPVITRPTGDVPVPPPKHSA